MADVACAKAVVVVVLVSAFARFHVFFRARVSQCDESVALARSHRAHSSSFFSFLVTTLLRAEISHWAFVEPAFHVSERVDVYVVNASGRGARLADFYGERLRVHVVPTTARQLASCGNQSIFSASTLMCGDVDDGDDDGDIGRRAADDVVAQRQRRLLNGVCVALRHAVASSRFVFSLVVADSVRPVDDDVDEHLRRLNRLLTRNNDDNDQSFNLMRGSALSHHYRHAVADVGEHASLARVYSRNHRRALLYSMCHSPVTSCGRSVDSFFNALFAETRSEHRLKLFEEID